MKNFTWQDTFLELFDRCLAEYRAGRTDWKAYYSGADLDFLASIGYQPREFFDFVEDSDESFAMRPAGVLLVAAVRRDYFHVVQRGQASGAIFPASELPGKEDGVLAGLPYLARILQKARLKLRGELDPEIMFGCGGDVEFLRRLDVPPADFLRHVWAAGEDDGKVVAMVRAACQPSA